MTHRTRLRRRQFHGPALSACLALALALLLVPSPVRSQDIPAAQPDSPYIGATACQDCHAAEHESWTRSKHCSSFKVLSDADAANDACIGCHSTGGPNDLRAANGTPHLPGTQCEACHGPGRAHATAARDAANTPRGQGRTLNVKPQTDVCERCHNRQSPRFQGFVYGPMARLVHAHPGR
jgi:hypothetical protein